MIEFPRFFRRTLFCGLLFLRLWTIVELANTNGTRTWGFPIWLFRLQPGFGNRIAVGWMVVILTLNHIHSRLIHLRHDANVLCTKRTKNWNVAAGKILLLQHYGTMCVCWIIIDESLCLFLSLHNESVKFIRKNVRESNTGGVIDRLWLTLGIVRNDGSKQCSVCSRKFDDDVIEVLMRWMRLPARRAMGEVCQRAGAAMQNGERWGRVRLEKMWWGVCERICTYGCLYGTSTYTGGLMYQNNNKHNLYSNTLL